ncbi:hypothetical protein [Phormidesmis priestleyi]
MENMNPNKPLELSAQELAAIAGGAYAPEGEKPIDGLYGADAIEKQVGDKLPELTQKIDELREPRFYASDSQIS